MKIYIRKCELVFKRITSEQKMVIREFLGEHATYTETDTEFRVVAMRENLFELLYKLSATYDVELI